MRETKNNNIQHKQCDSHNLPHSQGQDSVGAQQAGVSFIELMFTVAILAVGLTIGVASYRSYVDKGDFADAAIDIQMASTDLERFFSQNGEYPDTLAEVGFFRMDPWENPYEYLNIAKVKGKGKLRKDKNLVPINSDYDLYSKGPDGASVSPLTATASQDDIIRANNGAYIGPASDY